MLITRRRSLFSLTAITMLFILLLHSIPVIAGSRLLAQFNPHPQERFFSNSTVIADRSIVTTKQHPSPLLHQLNLTSTQKERIHQIHHQYKQQIFKKRQNLQVLQKQLSDSIVGTESIELIRAQNQQLVNLRREIEQLRFETILATREILTPEQRQKFREIVESQLSQ